MRLAAGSGAWASLSDRAAKVAITPLDARDVLRRLVSIPVSRWSYAAQGPGITHIGPMAQDFAAAFGVGEDAQYIDTIDSEGVALAAIQGLHQELLGRDATIETLRQQMATQGEQIAALQHVVAGGSGPPEGPPWSWLLGGMLLGGLLVGGGVAGGVALAPRLCRK